MTVPESVPNPLLSGSLLASQAQDEVDLAAAEAERVRRGLMMDLRRVKVLRRVGPGHERYVQTCDDMRGYGVGTLMKLHRTGRLHATVQSKTGIPELPAPLASWTPLEIPSLIALSVLRSVDPFMKSAILEGGWKPSGGARLKTFFLVRCYYAYADDYRRAHRAEVVAARQLLSQNDPDVELEVPGRDLRAPDPGPERIVIDRDWIRRLLEDAPDVRVGVMVFLQSEGMSVAEIAEYVGLTAMDVQNALRNLRRSVGRRGQS